MAAEAATATASSALEVKGFSHSTCFPAAEGGHHPTRMEAVGEGNVDSVDVRVLDHRLIAVGHSRNPVPPGVGVRSTRDHAPPPPRRLPRGWPAAGRMSAAGAMRAAPNTPNLTLTPVMATTPWVRARCAIPQARV